MDCDIRVIKKNIKHQLELHEIKYPSKDYPEADIIRNRIRNISSKLTILQKFSPSPDFFKTCTELFDSIKKLPKPTESEKTNNSEALLKKLIRVEEKLIQVFLIGHQINEEEFEHVLFMISQTDSRLDLTGKMRLVYENHVFNLAMNLTFIQAWELYLFPFCVQLFKLHDLEFIRNFSRVRITPNNRETDIVQRSDVVDLTILFIENSKNYKFFLEACQAYSSRNRVRVEETVKVKPYEIKMVFTKYLEKPAENTSDKLEREDYFVISNKGLIRKKEQEIFKGREDGFVTIGNHCFADIRLPVLKKSAVVLLAVIFWRNSNYYIQDVCRDHSVIRKLKMRKKYDLRPEMVFILSRQHYLRMINTRDGPIMGRAHSTLSFEFIKGPFSEVMGDSPLCRVKYFKTENKNPEDNENYFVLGKGGQGFETDFLISFDKTISKRHMVVSYSRQGNKWTVCDYDSKNGNYLLIKDYPQIINMQQSYAKLLLPDYSEQNRNAETYETMAIQDLCFFIQPQT
jgi:hypothetical protein